MYVVRCPVCRQANVREPLANHAVGLLQARDRVEAAKTRDDRLDAIGGARRELQAIEKALESVRDYLFAAERECSALPARPVEAIVPEYRSDPPPPEFRALLARKLPPSSPIDAPVAAAPERRPLPPQIAAEMAALKSKLAPSGAPASAANVATYGRLRTNLGSLQPLLAQIADLDAPSRTWESQLRELVTQEPLDRAGARSFVEALAAAASGWHRYDSYLAPAIARIAVACREQIELSLGILPRAVEPAAVAEPARPVGRTRQR